MEDYGLLAILVFLIFLLTVGLIITKKVEFVRALPAFGIVTAILAGTPITGSEYSIADYVIAKGADVYLYFKCDASNIYCRI